jgi:hypothetical protein
MKNDKAWFKIIIPKEARDMMLVHAKDRNEAWRIMQKQFHDFYESPVGMNDAGNAFGYEEFLNEEAPVKITDIEANTIIMRSKSGKMTVGKTKGWR